MTSKGDATRAGILKAARARFATDGYQKATIRAIAADAGIDPSMVMRYYGNKERLFAAAVDIDLRLPDIAELPPDEAGPALVGHFLRRWEGDPSDDALLTLLRSAATDEGSAERAREIFREQILPIAVRLAGGDPAVAAERAGLVATQMLGLALCRIVLRLPPLVAMDPPTVAARIGPTLQRYLTAPM